MYGFLILLGLACIVSAFSVSARLTATSFGFQVIVQNGTTTAFNQDTAVATDLESAISYPTAEGGKLDFGVVNLAFPSISRTLDQTWDVTHTDFSQTSEFAEFSYLFTSVRGT